MDHGIKFAPWALAEQRRQERAGRPIRFLGHIRRVFVLLFIAAVFVFVFNHQVEFQRLVSDKYNQLMKKTAATDEFRQKALQHEKEVNQIAK